MNDQLKVRGINSKGFGTIPKLIMQDRSIGAIAKCIYAYFCSFAGGGDQCFPTRKKICYDLGISNDTLSKYLRQLIESGYISCEQIKEHGKFSHNVYTLETNLPCPKNSDTENSVYGKLDTNKNSSNNNNSFNNNSNNKEKNNKKEKVEKLSDDVKKVVDLYKETCVSFPSIRSITDKRKKAIAKLLKQFTFEEIKEAFIKAEQTPFLKGHNERGWKADFDFMTNTEKVMKILEGFYNDQQNNYNTSRQRYNSRNEYKDRKPSYDIDEYERTSGNPFDNFVNP
jgi:hypothetical protein